VFLGLVSGSSDFSSTHLDELVKEVVSISSVVNVFNGDLRYIRKHLARFVLLESGVMLDGEPGLEFIELELRQEISVLNRRLLRNYLKIRREEIRLVPHRRAESLLVRPHFIIILWTLHPEQALKLGHQAPEVLMTDVVLLTQS